MRIFRVDTASYFEVEVFYDTRYDSVNRQRFHVGVEAVRTKHWRVEPYFARQHHQRPHPRT